MVHSSDQRLKKNITTLDGALDKVLNLRGVSFEWKKVEGRMSNPQKGIQIGVVAQEVEAVVPELVKTGVEVYKSVAYANITALLIEAVKAHRTAGIVHIGGRFQQRQLLAGQGAFAQKPVKFLAGARKAMTADDFVHRHVSDIVPMSGVAVAGIAEPDK